MSPKPAAIYARISKDSRGDSAGVDRQLEDCRRLAALRGFEVISEHVDNDTSAAGAKHRPGFEAVLEHITSGEVGVVVAWAWDRLERNRKDALRLIEAGQAAKVTVALVRGSDIDMSSAAGRMVADILASVARAEIEAKGERQQRAGLQRAESGKPPARRAFGYLQDGQPHPEEAPQVARMFAEYLAGASIKGIGTRLMAEGVTTARGGRWDDTAVRALLKNPRYISERWYRGERITKGDWPPLISDESFYAVQAKLNDPSKPARSQGRRHLGTSLFRCWCGSMTRSSYSVGGQRVYVCKARRHMQRIAEPVDKLVLAAVSARLNEPDIQRLATRSAPGFDLAEMRQRRMGLVERIDSLGADYASGLLTGGQVRVATDRIRAELDDIESKLAYAGRGSALVSVAGADKPGDEWLKLPLVQQRAVLKDVVEVVLLPTRKGRGFDEESVRFDWISD